MPFHLRMTSMKDASFALVLSGGGQFGAYQAGFWLSVHAHVAPDWMLGASIGAVNGWAIAAGRGAEALAERWLRPGAEARLRWRWPKRALSGMLDARAFDEFLVRLCAEHTPRAGYGCALTELGRLRRRLVLYPEAGWRHVAASCALFGLLPQIRLNGRLYTDGGLLGALPLWAAAEVGATRVLGVDIWNPGEWEQHESHGVRTLLVRPRRALGSWVDMLHFSAENAARWVEMGRADGAAALPRIESWLLGGL